MLELAFKHEMAFEFTCGLKWVTTECNRGAGGGSQKILHRICIDLMRDPGGKWGVQTLATG